MSQYGKIYVRVWADQKFRELSPIQPCGQGLWIYLLAPRERIRIPGVLPVGEMAIAESLKWSIDGCHSAFRELEEHGFIRYDFNAPLIWVPNALKYEEPDSSKTVRGWKREWSELPECPLKNEIGLFFHTKMTERGNSYRQAFEETCYSPTGCSTGYPIRYGIGSGMACQDQDQDQDQLQEQEQEAYCNEARDTRSLPAAQIDLPGQLGEVVVSIPCIETRKTRSRNGHRDRVFDVHEHQIHHWETVFPGVNVKAELLKAREWVETNPTKRKTLTGVPNFIRQWLTRAQNNVGRFRDGGPAPRGKFASKPSRSE